LTSLVPVADLCNHKHPEQCRWIYPDSKGGYSIQALVDIPKGGEIFISYNQENSNSYLFRTYGFIQQENDEDYVLIKAEVDKKDPLYDQKLDVSYLWKQVLPVTRNLSDE
jgi:hypothetical protein